MAKQDRAESLDKVRIQIDVAPAQLAAMDQLMTFCDLSKRKELFDVSMSLLAWAVDVSRSGRKIASYDRETDHVETILVPALEAARNRAEHVHAVRGPAVSRLEEVVPAPDRERAAGSARKNEVGALARLRPSVVNN